MKYLRANFGNAHIWSGTVYIGKWILRVTQRFHPERIIVMVLRDGIVCSAAHFTHGQGGHFVLLGGIINNYIILFYILY